MIIIGERRRELRSPLATGYMPDLHDRITGANASGVPKIPNTGSGSTSSKQKQNSKLLCIFFLSILILGSL